MSLSLAFEAGLGLYDFYNLTPKEFGEFITGYNNRQKKEYKLARFISYFSIKPHLEKKSQSKKINDLIPFEWEKKIKKINKLSKEEFIELQRKWNFL